MVPQKLEDFVKILENTPYWKIASWLAELQEKSSTCLIRNVYSALLMIPGTQQLRFEPTMKKLKVKWNQSVPRYDIFYQVDLLIHTLMNRPPPSTEEGIREHLIILLRFFCLFRGVDLARCKNEIVQKHGMWFLNMQRKGQKVWSLNPIPKIEPDIINPRFWLQRYVTMTASRGFLLFWSLPNKSAFIPLSPNTINSITTRFLRANGLKGFTAHSTRGAAATTLLQKGVPPQVV